MNLEIKEIERFHLEASSQTYAAGMEAGALPGLPGAKWLSYDRPPFWYRDCYWTSPVGVSFGFTLIGHAELPKPIWWMGYDGWYDRDDPRLTKFLRLALLAGCRSGSFHGGRGPTNSAAACSSRSRADDRPLWAPPPPDDRVGIFLRVLC